MAIYKKGYYDLYMFQGDTGNIKINGIPRTADYEIYFEIRDQNGNSVYEKSVNSMHKSEVIIPISTEVSDILEPGTYTYGVKLCYDNGEYISEETVIPPLKNTSLTPSTYKNKALFLVYPKQIEGRDDQW